MPAAVDSQPAHPSATGRSSTSRADASQAAIEAGLIARVAAGETEKPMETLYDLYAPRIYGLGVRLLGDRAMAEDLVQETFLRLFRSVGRFDQARGTASAFISTIARNTALDMRRRRATRALGLGLEEAPDEPSVGDGVEQLLLGLDLWPALGRLSPEHAEVIRLSYEDDLSQRQIAARLGVPVGTVKSRVYHALRALRQLLEEGE